MVTLALILVVFSVLMLLGVGGITIRVRLSDGTVRRLESTEETSGVDLRSLMVKEGIISGSSKAKLRVQKQILGEGGTESTSIQLKTGEIVEVLEVCCRPLLFDVSTTNFTGHPPISHNMSCFSFS